MEKYRKAKGMDELLEKLADTPQDVIDSLPERAKETYYVEIVPEIRKMRERKAIGKH